MMNDKYIALAGLLAIGGRSVRDDIPTACTNGRDEKYGRGFCDGLNDPELRFLVLHENYHKLARHLHIYYHLYQIDPELANMACDFWINGKLVEENKDDKFATMTGGLAIGCYDEKYKDMSVTEIFNALLKKKKQGGGQGDPWDFPKPFDIHEWEDAQELSTEEQEELARDIDDIIRQGNIVAGKMGSGGNRTLEDFLQPQVNWREVMREFITDTCAGGDFSTYNKPNRRYLHLDIIMPSGVSERVEELVLAIDTSGSIGQRELTTFLSEVKGICDTVKPSKVRVLYWDTQVCRDEVYELDVLPRSTKPSGGGGTEVECVPQYMAEHGIKPQATIILTDGYLGGSWGQWNCPTLWVILDNKNATATVGKTLHVESENL
jgi:predicted metal-dependent peptidase